MMTHDLSLFAELIKDHSGLNFAGVNIHRLEAGLLARMHALALEPQPYAARLRSDATELQALVNALTVNETYFLREQAQLQWLVHVWVPRTLAARGRPGKLRILSAGCSSGEEPYSLAMTLLDARGPQAGLDCEIIGVDIDTAVLAKAASAYYTEFSFRGVPDDLRARHFHLQGTGWVLNDVVRSMVRFQAFNVLSAEPLANLRDFDVVLFRNVSIYFDTATRKRIQENFLAMMCADGILLTGLSESLANDLGVLHLLNDEGLFYFSRRAEPAVQKVPPPAAAPSPDGTVPLARIRNAPAVVMPHAQQPSSVPGTGMPLGDIQRLVQGKMFDAAYEGLGALLHQQPEHEEAQLLMAYVLLNRKDYVQAKARVEQVLDEQSWSIDALYLLGHIHRWQGQHGAAIEGFKRAVYACPSCWPAHYYLGGLHRETGNIDLARRALRAVQQLIKDGAPHGLLYVPVELPRQEMHHLCERQLAQLGAP